MSACRNHPEAVATHVAEGPSATKQADGRYVEVLPPVRTVRRAVRPLMASLEEDTRDEVPYPEWTERGEVDA